MATLGARDINRPSEETQEGKKTKEKPTEKTIEKPAEKLTEKTFEKQGLHELKLPETKFQPKPYSGPSYEEAMNLRKKYMNPSILLLYKQPVMIVEGKGQYVWDPKGKRYLDCMSGFMSVCCGHCHPRIVEAVQDQVNRYFHTTNALLNDITPFYLKELAEHLPKELSSIYLLNGGAEAVDLSIFMSRVYTQNATLLSFRNAYHGLIGAAYEVSGLSGWKHDYPIPEIGVQKVDFPDLYRGPYQGPDAIQQYVNEVERVIGSSTNGKVAGFIFEPIMGGAGCVEIPKEYLSQVFNMVHKAGGLCIADEVQTGFGRTGTHFWGFERLGVIPDIVVMAKSMAGSFPMSAVACRPEIAEALSKHPHLVTFGGNPISVAAARTVLKIIDEEKLQKNVNSLGEKIREGLRKLVDKYDFVGDVRGSGFMLGIDFVASKKTKVPNSKIAESVFERCKDYGLLLALEGFQHHVLRIVPPYIINESDVKFILDVFDKACEEELKSQKA